MQTAICALPATGIPVTARCAELGVSLPGIRRKVTLGGFGEAVFPNKSQWALNTLRATDVLLTEWRDLVMHGEDRILGPITTRLIPERMHTAPKCFVTSVSKSPNGPFFPANSLHHLFLRVDLPRFGSVFESDEPVTIASIINSIPPLGSTFHLEHPTLFRMVSGPKRWRWLLDPLRLESCNVRAVPFGGLDGDIGVTDETGDEITFAFRLRNYSGTDLRTSWRIWPEPPCGTAGNAKIKEAADTHLTVTMRREFFTTQRWLTVTAFSPFSANAAHVVKFPLLRN